MDIFKFKLTGFKIFLMILSYVIGIALWFVVPLVMLGVSLTMTIWFVQKYHRVLFSNEQ